MNGAVSHNTVMTLRRYLLTPPDLQELAASQTPEEMKNGVCNCYSYNVGHGVLDLTLTAGAVRKTAIRLLDAFECSSSHLRIGHEPRWDMFTHAPRSARPENAVSADRAVRIAALMGVV